MYLAQAEGEAGFEKPVVLKTLRPELADGPRLADELAREAAICVRLDHEGIVQVLDFGIEDGVPFMVMEYVRGHPLSRLLQFLEREDRRLPTWAIAHIGRRLLAALAHAHELTDAGGKPVGLVHRDVSASNLLIGADGRVKLSDFGIARIRTEGERTKPGVLKGKFAYMAPEALEERELDQRYDLFGAAGVLYRALCGRPPWNASSDARRLAETLSSPVTPVHKLNPDAPVAFADVIMRGLARDPEQRWQTAAMMRGDSSMASCFGCDVGLAPPERVGNRLGDRPLAADRGHRCIGKADVLEQCFPSGITGRG